MSTPRSKERFSIPMVGGSSLLIIFAVLCLTIFTLLALSTVQANRRLSEASIQAVTDYYAADHQAQQIFARLRAGELPEGVVREVTFDDSANIGDSAAAGDSPPITLYHYSCSISDTQQLEVTLSHDGESWTVLRWQAVSTTEY